MLSVQPSLPVTDNSSLNAPPADKPAVLVVDDEYGPRESIAFTLAAEFAVDTAGRAVEALAKIKEKSYAVIVLDIRMPEMDGIRALEELRKIDPEVAVIMLTGYGTLLTAQQAMLAGANQYLRKPPDVAELVEAVRKQAQATRVRRRQAHINRETAAMNAALQREIAQNEPQIWQARASVELVHDLNNPLTVVIGYSTLLLEEARTIAAADPERGKRMAEYAAMVEKAAEYCQHLSESWRQGARRAADYKPVDLLKAIDEVCQVIFFNNLRIRRSGLTEAMVRGSAFELMRVFQNLFKNAQEAGASELELAVSRQGNDLELIIRDNGAGMSPEALQRTQKGGFTSKVSGTGLGLNICRHLLAAHGATLAIESAPGKGTKVRLVFPAAKA
jgi:signal transduction histidine kinase